MKDFSCGGKRRGRDAAESANDGGKHLGTLYEQKFFAMRAGADGMRFPFEPRPFTALIDIRSEVGGEVLESYARELVNHGCVQAVCRGSEAGLLNDVFGGIAEDGGCDAGGIAFTSMSIEDEPLREAIEYFVLPSGLAGTGLILVIGDSEDFQDAVQQFYGIAGSLQRSLSEPIVVEEELVCFDMV